MVVITAAHGLKGHPKFTDESLSKLESLWNDFSQNAGRRLDEIVREDDRQHPETSYINSPWKEMYLSDRRSLMMNYNPSIQLNTLGLPYLDQLRTATGIIIALARFHLTLRDGYLEPDGLQMGDKFIPLDMSQFKNLLCSTRIPRTGMDEIKRYESRHLARVRNRVICGKI